MNDQMPIAADRPTQWCSGCGMAMPDGTPNHTRDACPPFAEAAALRETLRSITDLLPAIDVRFDDHTETHVGQIREAIRAAREGHR